METAQEILLERVAGLDAPRSMADEHGDCDRAVTRFIRIVSATVPPGRMSDHAQPMEASRADQIVEESRLLGELCVRLPASAVGPLALGRQFWVATGRPEPGSRRSPALDEASFVGATEERSAPVTTKPAAFGLYTSSAISPVGYGMWWCYLQHKRSTLFPGPWHVWSVRVASRARVREITSATSWLNFVEEFPSEAREWVFPDWAAAAKQWDGIHVTLRAIAATQGIPLAARAGVVAPPYWDVESTLWLRWVFDSVELVRDVPA